MNQDIIDRYKRILNDYYRKPKSSTYKYIFLLSIIHVIVYADESDFCDKVWAEFAKLYWELIVGYQLKNGFAEKKPYIDQIMRDYALNYYPGVKFSDLSDDVRDEIIDEVKNKCSRCVVEVINKEFGEAYSFCTNKKFIFYDLSPEFIKVLSDNSNKIINNFVIELAYLYKKYNKNLVVLDIYNILCDVFLLPGCTKIEDAGYNEDALLLLRCQI